MNRPRYCADLSGADMSKVAVSKGAVPELLEALGVAIECMRTTEDTGDDGASDECIASVLAVYRKYQS